MSKSDGAGVEALDARTWSLLYLCWLLAAAGVLEVGFLIVHENDLTKLKARVEAVEQSKKGGGP